MHRRQDSYLRSMRYLGAIAILLLMLPGIAGADTGVNGTATPGVNTSIVTGTIVPVTTPLVEPVITVTITSLQTQVPVIHDPPQVTLNKTDTKNLAVTVYGSAIPGGSNATIASLRWNWGENGPDEYHDFPYSHTYANPGTYNLTITAFQSDGLNTTVGETLLIAGLPAIEVPVGPINTSIPGGPAGPGSPAGPGMISGAPVLTLLEPVISGLNVTMNGNIETGSRSAEIASVSIDWNDGYHVMYRELPASHQYSAGGVYTVKVTANQSDGQSVSKSLTVNVNPDAQVFPGPGGETPPPGMTPDLVLIAAVVVIVVIAGIAAQWALHRRKEESSLPDIRKNLAIQEGVYEQAMEKGDMVTAAASARACARMLKTLADEFPKKRDLYREMAATWEHLGENAGKMAQAPVTGVPGAVTPVREPPAREDLDKICAGTGVTPEVLESVIRVAMEIGREGREGQSVGTSFVVGDTPDVLAYSKQFVLNPFHGHKVEERLITDTGIRENIKEFAQLDGAFIITDTGVVEAAGRYITLDMSHVELPGGLGSRHSSIAGITLATNSIGIVVSQSGGRITIFRNGKIVATIHA